MFFVINKDKIYAYGLSILTVIILFGVASFMINSNQGAVLTSSNTEKLLPIYKDNIANIV